MKDQHSLESIVDLLNEHRQRATYGAVAGLLGLSPMFFMNGTRRGPRYSWIVNRETLLPTGYTEDERHPELECQSVVWLNQADLLAWLDQRRDIPAVSTDPAKPDGSIRPPGPPDDALVELPDADPPWLALRRDDLAAIVDKYRQENRQPRQWIGLATGVGGLVLAWLLVYVAAHFGAGPVLGWSIFAGGWAVALGSFGLVWRREHQLKAALQLECPACATPLLDGTLGRGGISRAELAIATGNCPSCGEQILAP